jgi:hypothetical protein
MKTILVALGLGLAAPVLAGPQAMTNTPSQAEPGMAGAERIESEASARAKLAAEGFGTVEKVERQEDGTWKATAMKNNVRQSVIVHSDGRVTPAAQPRG